MMHLPDQLQVLHSNSNELANLPVVQRNAALLPLLLEVADNGVDSVVLLLGALRSTGRQARVLGEDLVDSQASSATVMSAL